MDKISDDLKAGHSVETVAKNESASLDATGSRSPTNPRPKDRPMEVWWRKQNYEIFFTVSRAASCNSYASDRLLCQCTTKGRMVDVG